MSSALTPLDFSGDITRLTKDFTGRAWLFETLAKAIDAQGQQFILLTGEPGIGKSAFSARLLTVRSDIAAHHFCFARRVGTVTPTTVLRSIAGQLMSQLAPFGEALLQTIRPLQLKFNINITVRNPQGGGDVTGVIINQVATRSAHEDLEIFLRAPLSIMPASPRKAVILIDALDEALSYKGTPNLVELLAMLDGLPPWVTLFCTSRRSDAVLSHLHPLQPLILDPNSPANRSDVRAYVEKRAARPAISARLNGSGTNVNTFVAQVTERAAGNFLYTAAVLEGIAAGHLAVSKLEDLPPGLDSVYESFLRRFSDDDWRTVYRPLLGKLAVAQEPLTEDDMASFTGMAPSAVRDALGLLDQYLDPLPADDSMPSYELYHESLREFLLARGRAGRYWCNPDEEHNAIADHYLADYTAHGLVRELYGIRHLPLHLSRAGRHGELSKLLRNFRWLTTKLEATSVPDVLLDLRLVPRQKLTDDIAALIRLSAFALEHEKEQWWTQVYSRSLTQTVPVLDEFPEAPTNAYLALQTPTIRQIDDPLKWVFHGHTSLVKDVCAIHQSPLVASCSFDRTIRIWDIDVGTELKRLKGHTDTVSSLAATLDGSQLVSGGRDNTLRIWDLSTGQEISRIEGFPHWPEPVILSSDGNYMAALVNRVRDSPDTIWLWKGPERKLLRKISADNICNITFIPRTTWIAGRGHDRVVVWEVESGDEVRCYRHGGYDRFSGYSETALASSADGLLLASGGSDEGGRIKVFNLATDAFFALPTDRSGPVTHLAFSPDGSVLIAAGKPGPMLPDNCVLDDRIEVWDLKTRGCKARYTHDGIVQAIAVSEDNAYAIVGTGNGKVSVWDLQRQEHASGRHSAGVVGVVVRATAGRALSASIDGSLFVWNLSTLKVDRVLRSGVPLRAMDANADGSQVLTSGYEDTVIYGDSLRTSEVKLHDVAQLGRSVNLVGVTSTLRENEYTAAVLLPGRRAFLARHDADRYEQAGLIELWDLRRRKRVASATNEGYYVHAAAAIENGARVVTVSRQLCVWSLDDLSRGPRIVAERHFAMVALALSRDERVAAVGTANGWVELWELEGARQLTAFEAHQDRVRGVRFTRGGEWIVTVGSDHCLKLWDWRQGRKLSSFFGDSAFTAMDCSDDCQTLVVGEESGRVHFLRFEPGRVPEPGSPLRPFLT